jgi:hypothetical protein
MDELGIMMFRRLLREPDEQKAKAAINWLAATYKLDRFTVAQIRLMWRDYNPSK